MHWQVCMLCSWRAVCRLCAPLLLNTKPRGCGGGSSSHGRVVVYDGARGMLGPQTLQGAVKKEQYMWLKVFSFCTLRQLSHPQLTVHLGPFSCRCLVPSKPSCHLSSLGQGFVGESSGCLSSGADSFFSVTIHLHSDLSLPGRFFSFLNFCGFGGRGGSYR